MITNSPSLELVLIHQRLHSESLSAIDFLPSIFRKSATKYATKYAQFQAISMNLTCVWWVNVNWISSKLLETRSEDYQEKTLSILLNFTTMKTLKSIAQSSLYSLWWISNSAKLAYHELSLVWCLLRMERRTYNPMTQLEAPPLRGSSRKNHKNSKAHPASKTCQNY